MQGSVPELSGLSWPTIVIEQRPVAGPALDIIKAFNVLTRQLLTSLLTHLGYDPSVAAAWLSALHDMKRHVIVQGVGSVSTTGIPEGDPVSIVGMYVVSLPANWELVTSIERFVTLARLPLPPEVLGVESLA